MAASERISDRVAVRLAWGLVALALPAAAAYALGDSILVEGLAYTGLGVAALGTGLVVLFLRFGRVPLGWPSGRLERELLGGSLVAVARRISRQVVARKVARRAQDETDS